MEIIQYAENSKSFGPVKVWCRA